MRASVSTQSSLALSSEDVFQETQPFITSTVYQELLSFSWSCDGYESSNGSQYHAVRESQRENIFTNSRDSDISWVAISTVFCHHQSEAQDCKKNKTIEKKITFFIIHNTSEINWTIVSICKISERENYNKKFDKKFIFHNMLGQLGTLATLAQLVEHSPCKRMVIGSNPISGSIKYLLYTDYGL